jgi:hypothetical protein
MTTELKNLFYSLFYVEHFNTIYIRKAFELNIIFKYGTIKQLKHNVDTLGISHLAGIF